MGCKVYGRDLINCAYCTCYLVRTHTYAATINGDEKDWPVCLKLLVFFIMAGGSENSCGHQNV